MGMLRRAVECRKLGAGASAMQATAPPRQHLHDKQILQLPSALCCLLCAMPLVTPERYSAIKGKQISHFVIALASLLLLVTTVAAAAADGASLNSFVPFGGALNPFGDTWVEYAAPNMARCQRNSGSLISPSPSPKPPSSASPKPSPIPSPSPSPGTSTGTSPMPTVPGIYTHVLLLLHCANAAAAASMCMSCA
jgi:hypothetical protein